MTVELAEGYRRCPACGREFRSVSKHWSHRPKHRPSISQQQHDFLTGLLLGGAGLHTGNKNPAFELQTRYRDFALWVFEELGWLSYSLTRIPSHDAPDDETVRHAYRVRTHGHPGLNRYAAWVTDGVLDPPYNLSIRQRAVRAWYARGAYASWSGDHESRETGFSAAEEPRTFWVGAFLRELGYQPSYRGDSWFLSPTQTRSLIERVGGPVPGVEHKWAFDRETYDAIRLEQRSERERVADDAAIEPRVNVDLYPPGGHEDAIPDARVVLDDLPSLGKSFSDRHCLEALRFAREHIDEELTVSAYEAVRDEFESMPSSSLLQTRFGDWEAAVSTMRSWQATVGRAE